MTQQAVSGRFQLPGLIAHDALEHGSIFFVGTATTLIEYGGFHLITDPNFLHAGDHVHLGYGLTSKRLTEPALRVDQLPRLDACILSHLHGDHWDRIAEAALPRTLPIVTTEHAARALRGRGFEAAKGLRTWECALLHKADVTLRVTALPARHGPALVSRLLPPTMGSMLEWHRGDGPPVFRLWISGDTVMHPRLDEIPERYPDIPLALLHLGGTRVLGVLLTFDAEQGIRALRLVRPKRVIPIHYDDYTVFRSSLEDFLSAVRREPVESEVRVLHRGDSYHFDVAPSEREEIRAARRAP